MRIVKNKRKISAALAIMSIWMITPVDVVLANEKTKVIADRKFKEEDMKIISSTIIGKKSAKEWAKKKGATQTFIDLADLYWGLYSQHGNINPGIAYVQSAIETGFGKFGGVLDESYKNPCGLKNPTGGGDYDPNAHFRFNTWEEGVKAHLDHLALYAGADGYPRALTYDPRHFTYLLNTADTVQGLSSKWASDSTYGLKIMKNYNELLELNKKENKMWIEKPSNSMTTEGQFTISGWGLNDSGVQAVKVYIDGMYIKNLQHNIVRSDVANIYPDYINSNNAGFEGDLDLSRYEDGKYTLRVDVVGCDNSVDSQYISINKTKKENKMWIDNPQNNSITKNNLEISGWALNNSGIRVVNVYIDGKYIDTLETNLSRPDVDATYPGYTNGEKSGFRGIIDLSGFSNDVYTVKVEAVGYDNSITTQYVNVNKTSKESKMWIESLGNGEVVNDVIKVSGWALNESGIDAVKVYVDNEYIQNVNHNISRPDVNNTYPGYKDGNNAGFEGNLEISDFSVGQHTLRVEVVGKDGSKDSQTIVFHKSKKESKMWIEFPKQNEKLKNELKILGWGLNDAGIKSVKAYLDGKYIKDLNFNISRPDVNVIYPDYKNSDSAGFEGTIDISNLVNDKYTLRVDVIGTDNTIQSQYVSFERVKKESRMWIEAPSNYDEVENKLKISGWALNDSGIESIKVYIDGKYSGQINHDISRPDVENIYPGYTNGDKSGFEGSIDLSKYSEDTYNIRVDAIGKDKSVLSQYINIYRKKKESKMWIESPSNYQTVENEVNISGWGLNDAGIKEVKVYLDDIYVKNLNHNIRRSDVNNVYPGYTQGENSGFEGTIDLSNFTTGIYNLRVDVIGKDNSVQSSALKLKINKKELRGWIDSPRSGVDILNGRIRVEGWGINDTGIKNVNIYLNGHYQSKDYQKITRLDIYNAYPEYSDSKNSGFRKDLDLTNVLSGKNTLKIEVVFNNGEKFIDTRTFNSIKPNIIDLNLNFDFGPEGPLPNNPDKLVLHHAAGNSTVTSVHNYHKNVNGWAGIGYHFYIHKDGTIYRGRKENWRGAHAAEVGTNDGNLSNDTNATSIGISVQGNYHPEINIPTDTLMPRVQEDAIVELGQYLVAKYGMMEVFKHGSPGIGHTSCPGDYYPFERIKSRILSKFIYGVYNTDL